MRADQAALQLAAQLDGDVPGCQRTEAGRYPVMRLLIIGQGLDDLAGLADLSPSVVGNDDLGIVPRHRFQVFERDRADTHRDAVLFHESIAAAGRPVWPLARASEFVRSSSTQVDHPSRGHFVEPVEREGPASVAEQLIVDRESFQRPNRPNEVDGLLHCRPGPVRRDGKDVDAVRNRVVGIAGVEQRRLILPSATRSPRCRSAVCRDG